MTDTELELDEQYLNDGLVECDCCGRLFPESALAGDGLCGDCSLRVFGDAAEWALDDADILGLRYEEDLCERTKS